MAVMAFSAQHALIREEQDDEHLAFIAQASSGLAASWDGARRDTASPTH
jgi:hypothetical protein